MSVEADMAQVARAIAEGHSIKRLDMVGAGELTPLQLLELEPKDGKKAAGPKPVRPGAGARAASVRWRAAKPARMPLEDRVELGRRAQEARKAAGMTQAEAGRLLGLKPGAVSSAETGMSPGTARKLLAALEAR